MSRRNQIQLTDAEVDAYLHEPGHTLNVASFGPDGGIHLVAMWYGFVEGRIAFHTYGKSQKMQNFRRDPRFTALVETGSRYEELKGVELVGTVELIDDLDWKLALVASSGERYPSSTSTHRRVDDPVARAAFLSKRSEAHV